MIKLNSYDFTGHSSFEIMQLIKTMFTLIFTATPGSRTAPLKTKLVSKYFYI